MRQFFSHARILGKLTLKDKSSLFWVFIYPLILVSMMALAFSGLGKGDVQVKAAVERGHPQAEILTSINQLEVRLMDSDEAVKALRDKELDGFFRADGKLEIREDSLEAQVLAEVGTALKQAEAAARQGILPDFSRNFLRTADQSADFLTNILSMTVAMFAFYSYFSGIGMIDHLQANLSPLAARLTTTPLRRTSYLAAGLLINSLLAFLNMVLLTFFLKWVWGVNFLFDPGRTLLLLLVTALLGVASGLFVGSSNKLSTKAKVPLGIAVMLILGAFGGMMGTDLRLFMDRHVPWLNRVNPISLVGRLIYRLNALSSTKGYGSGLLALVAAALLLYLASLLFLRRRRFKSL